MAIAEMLELMTAEEFGRRLDPGHPEELVRGRVVTMSVPDREHGYVCGRTDRIFGNFVDERWLEILDKVSEYLSAGVLAVVVLDPEPQVAHVFSADSPPSALRAEQELHLPGILDGFRVRVGRFFE